MANVSLAMSYSVKTLKAYTLYGTETILKFDSYPLRPEIVRTARRSKVLSFLVGMKT